MKRILFIGYNFFDYEKKIKELIENELGYTVFYINNHEIKYEYKNFFEKCLNNFYWKIFKKKNLKDEKRSDILISKIERIRNEIDEIFWIRATGDDEKVIKYLKKLNKRMILHEWDSVGTLSGVEKYFKYFNKVSTFDPNDAQKYNISFIPNFYGNNINIDKIQIEYDAYIVISADYRIDLLEKLAKKLKTSGKKYKFLVYSRDKNLTSNYLEIINEPISLEENYKYFLKSKVIVEIGHPQQKGLSFRAIDSVGLKKKLITNYKFIKNYDFYDEKNICIIEKDNVDIPKDFFDSKYKEIDKKIIDEYDSKNWIKKIIGEKNEKDVINL